MSVKNCEDAAVSNASTSDPSWCEAKDLPRQQCGSNKPHELEFGINGIEKLHKTTVRSNTSFHHYRFVVVMMGGLSLGCSILLRNNISVAIINMVNQTALYLDEHPDKTVEDFLEEGYDLGGEFNWNNEIQQMIMSWYMIAYTLPQVACTKLAIKIGGRLAAPIMLATCALSNLLTPAVAYWGWHWVVGLRLINGLGSTAIFPMMLDLIEHWMPEDEVSLGLTYSQLLQAIMTAAYPIICGYLSAAHWSYAFYVPGAFVLVFCFLWLFLISDTPEQNALLSQKELDLIKGCNGAGIRKGGKENHNQGALVDDSKETTTNGTLLEVMRSPVFYAYIFIWSVFCSTHTIFSCFLPTYLRQFLKIDVADNGTYCFIIQTGVLLAVLWPHPLLRLLQTKFGSSLTNARRIVYAIICVMTAGTWIYIGLYHDNQLVVLFINRCFQNGNDIIVTSALMSNYSKSGISSLVFSLVNTIADIPIVFASPLVGYVLDYTAQSVQGWSWIYHVFGFTQLLIFFAFIMIKSEPIEFKKRKNKGDSLDDSRIDSSRVDDIELKIDSSLRNNFGKSKITQVTSSNEFIDDDSSDRGLEMKV